MPIEFALMATYHLMTGLGAPSDTQRNVAEAPTIADWSVGGVVMVGGLPGVAGGAFMIGVK